MFFIAGTDTNIGKTLVSSWLCAHTHYAYFKPIQTGAIEGTDRQTVSTLAKTKIYRESYVFKDALSPHLAARRENIVINIDSIQLPQENNLIIEGAGGLLVPLTSTLYIIDLIKKFDVPVILVCSPKLGTINHTLLSLEALLKRDINVCGVVMSGETNTDNVQAIEFYGQVSVLGCLPLLGAVSNKTLLSTPLPKKLQKILGSI